MNKWTKLSIITANGEGYLDKLVDIYPGGLKSLKNKKLNEIKNNGHFNIRPMDKISIKEAFIKGSSIALVKCFLKLNGKKAGKVGKKTFRYKFPIKNSYIGFLKRHDSNGNYPHVVNNPKVVKLIAKHIVHLGINGSVNAITSIPEANRQNGPAFKDWLKGNFKTVTSWTSFNNTNGPVVLLGSDTKLKKIAANHLHYNNKKVWNGIRGTSKGIDLFAKSRKGKIVIGEAKWLTDEGGHQNDQFTDAMNALTALNRLKMIYKINNFIPIAIIDGVTYLESTDNAHSNLSQMIRSKSPIISAVLIKRFLDNN